MGDGRGPSLLQLRERSRDRSRGPDLMLRSTRGRSGRPGLLRDRCGWGGWVWGGLKRVLWRRVGGRRRGLTSGCHYRTAARTPASLTRPYWSFSSAGTFPGRTGGAGAAALSIGVVVLLLGWCWRWP